MAEDKMIYLVLGEDGAYVFAFEDGDQAEEYSGHLGDARVIACDVVDRRLAADWLHQLAELGEAK